MSSNDDPRDPVVLQPAGWPRPSGYSNGMMAEGRILHIAGQIGWDPVSLTVAADLVAQVRQALQNIVAVLGAGGASASHVVRLTWYVTDLDDYRAARREIGRAFRDVFGSHYPPMSLLQVSGLLEPGAVVEIEATAVVPHGRTGDSESGL